ncbi:hypothetical protein TIFTF001_015300 [Ficus carica]|uniref:Uncharacterized protein n=1 Tax=Ficus carica TaxID=3494 RepID=A0AA88A0Z2_FICCA|nr:hypothetical protein TIFTF001_015300 [Ficus carica]
MDQVNLGPLARGHGPKELLALNGNRTLDLMLHEALSPMDVAQYKPYAPLGISRFDFRSLSRLKRTGLELVRDGDMDAANEKLKSDGYYWSRKYVALESLKNLKHLVSYSYLGLLGGHDADRSIDRNGARVGEEGAFGWSTLLEAEENWRRVVNAKVLLNAEEGGWTGWPEPLAKIKIDEDTNVDDDNEALPRKQGIDIDSQKKSYQEIVINGMAVCAKSGDEVSRSDGTPDAEADEHLSKVVIYEDDQ